MKNDEQNFVISEEDWSLHRKGFQDQTRHMEKVKEAIKNNLPDLITEESIIMSNGRDVIKIPIRSLDEYKIRYNYNKTKHVGQGDGGSKKGDVIARAPSKEDGDGSGKGEGKGGNQPGSDYYEAEVSLVELEEELFKELELPHLEEKDKENIIVDKIEFNDVRKKGLMGNIDKKRTILSALKRNASQGEPTIAPIYEDDLRFKTWNIVTKPESNAVVIAMMDTSASMGTFAKYLARSFFFWTKRFLHSKYRTVDMVYIAHHTEAKVVNEEEFFSKGESGGTICSSAYKKALELIDEKYAPSRYNIYPFHFSDGENFYSDNTESVRLVKEIVALSNMFGYGEVNAYDRYSTLMRAFKEIDNPIFKRFVLKNKSDVYKAMKHYFQKGIPTQ
ncbi:sporulation protein YhbH [Cerasibacillus terrae]|uniref:Sporulation protein YhbH n=1 Tax=Cerasibacillus terrae TaxID=2498845 RepID=A0A5C8NJZ7_9BACI|nr:sporulation protein YhbH [Cerasibacillus terrae]TXL61598.1 sporulation protein YhbH [Cerasibacillus terrae]